MKNLMVYINPSKQFDSEHGRYVKIQINNSLKYWRPDDIIFVTNFPYEYHGIRALELDNMYCDFDPKACKINVIYYLLKNNIINDITWFHDLEAWQINPFDLILERDIGLADYGWKLKYNTGVIFFKPTAIDVFDLLRDEMYARKANEEPALHELWKINKGYIKDRIQRLNITYNFGKREHKHNLKIAELPLKILHFHPFRENLLQKFNSLLPEDLKHLMKEHSNDNCQHREDY
jgi:hypothetical protein